MSPCIGRARYIDVCACALRFDSSCGGCEMIPISILRIVMQVNKKAFDTVSARPSPIAKIKSCIYSVLSRL